MAASIPAYIFKDGKAREKKGKGGPPAVLVQVARVAEQDVPVRLRAIGNVEAYATVAVRSRVDGQVVAVNFREGQAVAKGALLFRIDSRPFEAALKQAEANALRDRAARDQARSQAKRYEELLAKNFVSKEAYAQIRTNAETAEAAVKASEAALESARLNLEYCTIRAPLEGVAGRVLLQAGNMVRANDANPLVVLNQVRPVYVNFAVPEQNLPEIRKHMAAAPLTVEVLEPAAAGKLVFVDNAVDPSTGTIRLKAEFANAAAALWPGQFVTVSVRLAEDPAALVIPAQAVQTGPEGQYVYVVGEDMVAQVRRVEVARTEGEQAVVAKGLAKGEQVVTRGQLRLGPRSRVQVGKAS
ncbi:MAG: efflux RND transporter periplasmic adaptor subunit [Pseudomonadota bacterium]